MTLPADAQKIELEGSTVDFFKFTQNDQEYFYFDSSLRTAPEPMVNAMRGLSLVDSEHKLIMINHQKPMGLLGKLKENFDIAITEREDGNYQLIFSFKEGLSEKSDLSDTHCSG